MVVRTRGGSRRYLGPAPSLPALQRSRPEGSVVDAHCSDGHPDRKGAAGIPRHISSHSLRHPAITKALDAGVPLRDAQILARNADPRTTEHYDRARGNLDWHAVHFLTAHVAGV